MSDEMEHPPWWMSNAGGASDPGQAGDPGSAGAREQTPGIGDIWSMLGMISNFSNLGNISNLSNVGSLAGEWWELSGASNHAHHEDPSEHPDCLICKVLTGLQAVSQPAAGPTSLPPARWLAVRQA